MEAQRHALLAARDCAGTGGAGGAGGAGGEGEAGGAGRSDASEPATVLHGTLLQEALPVLVGVLSRRGAAEDAALGGALRTLRLG